MCFYPKVDAGCRTASHGLYMPRFVFVSVVTLVSRELHTTSPHHEELLAPPQWITSTSRKLTHAIQYHAREGRRRLECYTLGKIPSRNMDAS